MLVVVLLCGCKRAQEHEPALPEASPRDQSERERRAIDASVAGYVDALMARDPAAALLWVTSATFDYYDQLRVLALTGSRDQLEQRNVMEIVMILELRIRFTRAELEHTDGRALFEGAIAAGMYAEPLALDDVRITDEGRRAEVWAEGEQVLWLAREQGRWCIDLPAMVVGLGPVVEIDLADAILAEGRLRVAFGLLESQSESKFGLDLAILDGPVDEL